MPPRALEKKMRGRFGSLALIGLAALPGAQLCADSFPALRDATYSLAQPGIKPVPSTNPLQIAIVIPYSDTGPMPHVGARMITPDPSALALHATFVERSGDSLEALAPAS